jgi:FlaA1/EpsC-like NDP-sugar epimerase
MPTKTQKTTKKPASKPVKSTEKIDKNGLIVITGAGGFIGGNLVIYFKNKGFTRIRAVDKKPIAEWYTAWEKQIK